MGLIVLMVGANLLWILSYGFLWFLIWGGPSYLLYLIPASVFCAGGLMAAIGIYGQRRNYGSTLALATFMISIVFIWFHLIPEVIYVVSYSLGSPWYYPLFSIY